MLETTTSDKISPLTKVVVFHFKSLPDFKSNPYSNPYFNSLSLELLHNSCGRELKYEFEYVFDLKSGTLWGDY